MIIGQLTPTAEGTLVQVRMRPGIFALSILAGAAFAGISGASVDVSLGRPINHAEFAVLWVGLWLHACFGFWDDADSIKLYLDVVLEGVEVKPA